MWDVGGGGGALGGDRLECRARSTRSITAVAMRGVVGQVDGRLDRHRKDAAGQLKSRDGDDASATVGWQRGGGMSLLFS